MTEIQQQINDMIEDGEIAPNGELGRKCGCGKRAAVFCGFHAEWMCIPCLNNPDGLTEE